MRHPGYPAQRRASDGAAVRDDTAAADRLLDQAIAGFDGEQMAMHAAAARLRLGVMRDAARGDELQRQALDWFREQQVAAPWRLAQLIAPGPPLAAG